jgi:hypothetical protein
VSDISSQSLLANIQSWCLGKSGAPKACLGNDAWWINQDLLWLHKQILDATNFLPPTSSYAQKFWHITNKINHVPLCKYCVSETNWQKSTSRYSEYCSKTCAARASSPQREKTNYERYGHANAAKSLSVKEKIKQTTNQRYGVDNYAETDEFKQQMVAWAQTPAFEQSREKIKQTNLQKYGVENPFQSAEIRAKANTTLILNHGVDSPLKSEHIKERMIATTQQKYNRRSFNQTHISTESLDKIHDSSWVKNALLTKSLRTISEELGMSYTHVCAIIRDHGFDISAYSSFQREIQEYLHLLGVIDIQTNTREVLPDKKELDIFVPSSNIAIECNGTYWHSEICGKKDKNYHLNKTTQCETLGIQLIHIFEHDWYAKRAIVESRLLYLMGLVSKKIYARSTTVTELSAKQANEFFDQNHIQGFVSGMVYYALCYQGEIVAAMSFSKSRYTKKYEYELLRFCNLLNTTVVGGAGKLFKHFVQQHRPNTVISYADRCWSVGKLYQSLGFEFLHNSDPAYQYLDPSKNKVFNRQQFQKHKLHSKIENFDPSLTEWENMKRNNYDRIWDSGNSAWLYTNNN